MVTLPIGTRLDNADETVELLASKFNRHTFWCGQSGSGKTYALGVVLEQLLLKTELPLLILDPNADFVRLHETRAGAATESATAISQSDIRVLHSTHAGGERLHASFVNLSPASKAAVLQLDPIADAEEYNVLLHLEGDVSAFNDAEFLTRLRQSDDPGARRLALRIENLQTLEWPLWARGAETATQIADQRPRATVMDLGGFANPAAPKVAALSVLEHLWARRDERRPVLIVIDEAHNICPPESTTLVERALTEQIIQIAAEGRKFGLWLLLSTQRPTKIHPNVLSQCDNLALMRMNAPRDLAEVAQVFGFVPAELLSQSPAFAQGQALFAGGFVAQPTLTQMGARITEEGGSDVPVPLKV
ncbi:ATP-binding protein [Microbacterium sp. NC79]|uniref:ATP-binding protein n=1 Tax=Microbacterium sp. NC79 TaxID=2851009 RepID=UPI001C2CBD64|nr:ATP-binding protein [Microbacterium sp. NC79]MBV0895432.1 ATP-binding protein [Microbacterium sp. NC79]